MSAMLVGRQFLTHEVKLPSAKSIVSILDRVQFAAARSPPVSEPELGAFRPLPE